MRRIQTFRRGRLVTLIGRSPLLSSSRVSHGGWEGLILEQHMADAVYVARDSEARSHILHFFDGVPLLSEWRADGHRQRVQNLPGSMALEPTGFHFDVDCVRARPDTQWILALDPARFRQRVEESVGGGRLELTPHLNLTEPQVLALGRVLHADVEAGCPTGPLFGELVGAALAVQLARTCAVPQRELGAPKGGLPLARLRRVLEYIESHLESDLRLSALAETVGVSAFHFARLFKQSTGSSPHQYLLRRRIERAKALLHRPEVTLAEVGARTGFTDQSHFTKVFRRFVGATPAEYRAQL